MRAVDDLVHALLQRLEPRRTAAAGAEEPPTCVAEDDHGSSSWCGACAAAAATEVCGNCGFDLGLCRPCAEERSSQCEECEAWFCSDWCAARRCFYCKRAHVCAGCWESPLRRCPRPEC